jgi:hypothetical protein
VNDLALYMVSSETARIGIIKRSKYPTKPPIIRYRDVRIVVTSYLADPKRNVQPIVSAENMFSQRADDPSGSSLRQDDARQSIEVLHGIQGMKNQLGGMSFSAAPQRQGRLMISGVSVSSRIDLYVHGATRGVEQVGGASLRMTQDDAETESAKVKRKEAGLYVATVVRLHVEQNLKPKLPIANKLCMSIDIRHGEAFTAPPSNARRISDIESACSFITAIWPGI